MLTLPAATISKVEQAATAIVPPDKLRALEKSFATNVGEGTEELAKLHLKKSFAQPSAAGISQVTAGAVKATSAVEGLAHQANSTLMVGIPVAAVIGKTGTPFDMVAQMFPIEAIPNFALGVVDKVAGIVGGTIAAAGSLVGFAGLERFGEGIKSNTLKATAVPHAICETIGSPINHLRGAKVSEAHHVFSSGINHVSQQFDKLVPRKDIANAVDGAMQLPLFDVEEYSIERAAKIRTGLKNATKNAENIEHAAGEKISKVVDKVFGGNAEGVKNWAQNASIHRVAMQGTAIASSAAEIARTANIYREEYQKLEKLYCSVKELAPDAEVSPREVLFPGDMPNLYNEAKDQFLVKAPLAVPALLASTLGSWKMACSQNTNGIQGFGLMMGIAAATNMAMGFIIPKSEILELHNIASQVYAQKGELPAELIAGIITTATPSFAGRINQIKVEVLADHYHELKLSPAQLLKEITSGQIAATAYTLLDARNQEMAKNDLIDYDPVHRSMQRLGKDSPIAVAADHIYAYTMLKNAQDLPSLSKAVSEFLMEAQPSFRKDGINHDKLEAVAFNVAEQIIEQQIPPEVVVNKSSVGMVLEALEHLKKNPYNEVTEAALQGKAISANAPANKVGAMIFTPALAGIAKVNASHVASTVIPDRVSTAQLEEILAQKQEQTAAADMAIGTGSLVGSLAVQSPTKVLQEAQKKMVQDAIIRVGENNTGDLSKGFVKKMLTSGNVEFVERITNATSEKVLSKAQEELAKETAIKAAKQAEKELRQNLIKTAATKGTMDVGSNITADASGKIIEETTKAGANHATASMLAKAAPTIVSGTIALGGAAWNAHKSNEELLKLYAHDIHTKLGVDINKISSVHLHELAATDPNGKYASLNSELRKEFYGTAGAGMVGGIGGGAAGTVAGTQAGLVISGALATTGIGVVAAPVVIPTFAFIGGTIGSMVGGGTTTDFYKNIIGQDKETAIDAMRKLDQNLKADGQASAYEVAKVIIGDDAKIDQAAKQYNEHGKALHELPPEEQAKILINKYPELYQASQYLADKINNGELTNLVALTKINTGAAIEYGVDHVAKAVSVDLNVSNSQHISADIKYHDIVPFNRVSSQSVSAEPMFNDGKQLGTGVAGEIIAARAAAQGVEQSASRI